MKTFYYFLAIASIALLTSCGGSKPAVAQNVEIDIDVPCSGPEFQTNKEYFRASAMGLSTDMSTAKKKANITARSEIAGAISSRLKVVTDNYASSYQVGEQEEAKSRFQELARSVVDQQLEGVRVICEKTRKDTASGNYKVYMSIELSGKEIMEAMTTRIKNDEKLRIDFEYEKFKKVFEEEMAKSAQ
jgi:hypothetical protein